MSNIRGDFINNNIRGRVVPFSADLARMLGGANEAIFLQQCVYWGERAPKEDGWYYKTINDMREETYLSRYKQKKAENKLKELGLIETKVVGIMPTVRHIRVDFEKLKNFLESHDIEIEYAPRFKRDYVPKERESWEIGQKIFENVNKKASRIEQKKANQEWG